MTTQPTTTKEALELCPLARPVVNGVKFTNFSNDVKAHIWCYDCGLEFEGRVNEPWDKVAERWNSRVTAPIVAPEVNGEALIERIVEAVADFDDWEWCKCSECTVDARSHAVDTAGSLSAIVALIRRIAVPVAIRDEMPPSVKTGIDNIARHIARPIRGCATDDQYCDVLQRATDALTAAAETLTRKNTAQSTLAKAAEEIADRWFRGDLPEHARAQSTTRAMLRILALEVIERCLSGRITLSSMLYLKNASARKDADGTYWLVIESGGLKAAICLSRVEDGEDSIPRRTLEAWLKEQDQDLAL